MARAEENMKAVGVVVVWKKGARRAECSEQAALSCTDIAESIEGRYNKLIGRQDCKAVTNQCN